MSENRSDAGSKWQMWVGVFVGVGIIATIGYTVFETFAG
jgi:hypothetical protein